MDVDLKEVQRTLFMPLWGRAKLTQQGNPILKDPKAVEIVQRLEGIDFAEIDQAFSDFFNAAWIIRAKMFDLAVGDFLTESPRGNVVNLGAGVDTTFFRVDNGFVRWHDLDLPDVIALRKKLIAEAPRSKCIASSMFDPGWMETFQSRGERTLFLAGGVLYYFSEAQVKALLSDLAEHFPGGEIVMDTISEASIPYVNKGLTDSGNASALVKWGLSDAKVISEWDSRLTVMEYYPMCSRAPHRGFWGPKIGAYMAGSDAENSSAVLRIGMGAEK